MRLTAVYIRVSSNQQDTKSQEPDLQRWIDAYAANDSVIWYSDQASGLSMDRPGWNRLQTAINAGEIERIVVWGLDRLGRTASGLTALFDDLTKRKINLVSVKDCLDLSTPAGRLMANVLASVAQFETEVRGERVCAGIAKAKADGKRWGGSKPGVRKKVTDEQIEIVRHLKAEGTPITRIAQAVQLSRPTVRGILKAT